MTGPIRHLPRPLLVLATLVLATLAADPGAGASPRARAAADANPFAAARLYVDPQSEAGRTARAWRASRPADAAQLAKIAAEPQADWYDYGTGVGGDVAQRVTQITAQGALPLLVAYYIPKRDCGSFSSGGASSPAAYQRWIRAFARGIGARPAAVILEPDALAGMSCLSPRDQRTRLHLVHDAVNVLSAHPGVAVYVDAGNSDWQSSSVMAARLRAAGAGAARGFSLDVSNFRTTAQEIAYGHSILRSLPGRHFVIDTSRNGLGPTSGDEWCNPAGRALGTPPTAQTADPAVDALLWIKTPGESDGSCRGSPPAGTWWPAYALGLARRAAF